MTTGIGIPKSQSSSPLPIERFPCCCKERKQSDSGSNAFPPDGGITRLTETSVFAPRGHQRDTLAIGSSDKKKDPGDRTGTVSRRAVVLNGERILTGGRLSE